MPWKLTGQRPLALLRKLKRDVAVRRELVELARVTHRLHVVEPAQEVLDTVVLHRVRGVREIDAPCAHLLDCFIIREREEAKEPLRLDRQYLAPAIISMMRMTVAGERK